MKKMPLVLAAFLLWGCSQGVTEDASQQIKDEQKLLEEEIEGVDPAEIVEQE